jgi:preprotein translocase subunit YajC
MAEKAHGYCVVFNFLYTAQTLKAGLPRPAASGERGCAVYTWQLPVYSYSTENFVFISNAYAQTAGSAESSLLGLLPIILMFVVLWFLMIRPQMKRQKEHKAMVEALAKGDEVVTAGGIVGKVTAVKDQYVSVEVAQAASSPVEMLLQKSAVQTVLPKGTIKAL